MRWQLLLTIPTSILVSFASTNGLYGQETICPELTKKAGAQKASEAADKLYHRVWNLIKEEFYKPDYNGQDWQRWEHRYDHKMANMDDAHVAISTMLDSLGDRYTRFLDREAFDDEKSQIDAKLCGIGVQIGLHPKSHRVVIVAPIEGTPASRAGVMAGDEIDQIDSKSTKGFSVEDAAKHIRGEEGSQVVLDLLRDKGKVQIKVVRAQIKIKAVQTARMLDGDVGYIRLSSFISQEANSEVKDALSKLSAAKGIVFDLRDNPGGLLSNAIDISNMFLKKGNIVSTVDRDGYKTPSLCDGNAICDKPLVVLINKGSASASEITSGALHDNGRAVLVGQTTFGKGLVQGINKLEDGSGVNITIARYLTPADVDIHKKGIGPDVAVNVSDKDFKEGKGPWWEDPEGPTVKRAPEDMKDLQLKTAVQVLKKQIGEEQLPVALRTQAYKH
jgi:carboxyl-terminal processing protease